MIFVTQISGKIAIPLLRIFSPSTTSFPPRSPIRLYRRSSSSNSSEKLISFRNNLETGNHLLGMEEVTLLLQDAYAVQDSFILLLRHT